MEVMSLEQRLDVLLSTRPNYQIYQENGQRFYKAKNWSDEPQRGSEIFIKKLPRNCYEDEMVPLFERFGTIYMLRLMMDFSGTNRGYAFLTYSCVEEAERAIVVLDQYEIRTGYPIGVMKSFDNCRLFIGNIPKSKNKQQILNEVRRATDNVKDVVVYFDVNKTNQGFAFVEYTSHKDAALARRILINHYPLWNLKCLRIDWAKPKRKTI